MKRKLSTDGKLFFIDIILVLVIIIESIVIFGIVKGKGQKTEDDSYFMLYKGVEMQMTEGTQNPLDISTELEERSANKKYNTTYYNYENGNYTGLTEGKYKYDDGYMYVENVGKIAFSKEFNAIPRQYE